MTPDSAVPGSESVSGSQSLSRFGASSTGNPLPLDSESGCDHDADSDPDTEGGRPYIRKCAARVRLPARERKP